MTTQSIKAGLAYFALVFGAGFVLGALRVSILVPRLGERISELSEMPLMFAVIVIAARFVTRRFAVPFSIPARLGTGLLALGLLLAAELLLAVILQDRTLANYVTSRDPVSGSVYLAMLLLFALMPAFIGQTDNPTLTPAAHMDDASSSIFPTTPPGARNGVRSPGHWGPRQVERHPDLHIVTLAQSPRHPARSS